MQEEMVEELNVKEILKVEQMPKVFEDLEKIGLYLEKELDGVDKLECTEANKQDVKKKRALINNTKTILENRRKEIRAKILEPYDLIETKYNAEVKSKIDNAITILDDKISSIEDGQKENIKTLCETYFNEYAKSKDIDFVTLESMNLKITLGLATEKGSLTKKTQTVISEFIDQREKDLILIKSLEHSDEILVEYKKSLNAADSIAMVMDRYKELEQLKEQKAAKEKQVLTDEVMLNKIESLSAPVEEVKHQEELVTFAFEFTGPMESAKIIVNALRNVDCEFRQLEKVEGHYE